VDSSIVLYFVDSQGADLPTPYILTLLSVKVLPVEFLIILNLVANIGYDLFTYLFVCLFIEAGSYHVA
jgi:hypothetical protein